MTTQVFARRMFGPAAVVAAALTAGTLGEEPLSREDSALLCRDHEAAGA